MAITNELRPMLAAKGRHVFTLGVVLLILGILAVALPFVSGLAIQFTLGFLLIAAGATWIVFAFHARSWGSGLREGLVGALTLVAGIIMVTRPLLGLSILTLVLASYFCVTGFMRIILAFHLKPVNGWGWTLVNGVVSLLLGVLVMLHWPSSTLWVVGTLIGIDLIFAGISLMGIGSVARKVAA